MIKKTEAFEHEKFGRKMGIDLNSSEDEKSIDINDLKDDNIFYEKKRFYEKKIEVINNIKQYNQINLFIKNILGSNQRKYRTND